MSRSRLQCALVPANTFEWVLYLIGVGCEIAAIVALHFGLRHGFERNSTWRPNRWFRADTLWGKAGMFLTGYLLIPAVTATLVAVIPPNGC